MASDMSKKILVWFRNDLRLHDNEMLVEAIAKSDEILPVYCFDPRHFEATPYHSFKTGALRTQFLLESVAALRKAFQSFGGDILVLQGKPEELLPGLVETYSIAEVYHHREVASEETAVSMAVEDALWKQKINLRHFIGHTLYNKEDLPFPIKDIPDVFTQFKKKTERDAVVKPCFLTPTKMNFVNVDVWGEIPTINTLLGDHLDVQLSNTAFIGGEDEALKHLHHFLHTGEGIALANASLKKHAVISKLSPWLSLGCLSPREVYWKMKEAEGNYGLKPYFNQIIVGLLWRDYYRFMFKKHGNIFFTPNGFGTPLKVVSFAANEKFESWKSANTGQPLVDAFLYELNTTGYLPNLARQLVSTYLVHELGVNWVLGAAYFEERLLDYSPASNWGNWAAVAGVGNDERLTKHFEFEKLLKTVDPKGNYLTEARA